MTTKTVYVADDGKVFSAEDTCKWYEDCLKRDGIFKGDADNSKIHSLRYKMTVLNADINVLKSNAKYCDTLSRLTQDLIAKRAEYKRDLKMTDFSVKSMLALDKSCHAACAAYEKWNNAVRRLRMLRMEFASHRTLWHGMGYKSPKFR